uniref:G-protein coupled receptors family 1 profile domain-containing protein n=1 Tax=Gopherus agassizii TaxID=38772 RepID=A0A452GW69_9SAUR
MSAVNDTKFSSAVFLLTGIHGQEDMHLWFNIPLGLMYVFSIVGNSVILFIIKTDPSLHEPMYIFLSMLAITDLGLSIVTIPTTLDIFLEISFDACFAQLFFIHSLQCIESSTLLLMAFDHFIAIVMKMACSDIRVNSIYGLFVTISTVLLDSLLILLSYVMILKTVLSIASYAECVRALSTCVSHLCAVLIFYISGIGLSVVQRFGNSSSPLVQILMGYVCLLVPPMMNPIVCSLRSKHLRARIIRSLIHSFSVAKFLQR